VREELQPGDPERIGPYRVIRPLGRGGMGRVALGRSAGGRAVAVKVLRADLAADHEFRVRFRREDDAARKVNGLYKALVVDGQRPANLDPHQGRGRQGHANILALRCGRQPEQEARG
jgi:serine/threonine protein kinase